MKLFYCVHGVLLSTLFLGQALANQELVPHKTTDPTVLLIKKFQTEVDGKPAELFRIEQPDGTWGYKGVKGQVFDAIVKNQTDKPTVLHWHGLIVPNDQDGVPYVTQAPIPPGG